MMPDREKVIKGLEICSDCGFCESIKKFDLRCPYRNNDGKGCDRSQLLMDAIALLKEQEAVEPLPQNSNGWVRTIKLWYCGACHSKISRRTSKYCPNCGRAVNWDA